MTRLVYVIGASGAGKDSLLKYARSQMPKEAAVVFAHRYITRDAYAGNENHIALSAAEFEQRQLLKCFAMSWFSHETHYGIGVEIDRWLAMGITVVINGSRAYLKQATMQYPELLPVLIEADESILRQRLENRKRESKEEIEHRLRQATKLNQEIAPLSALVRIKNNSSIEQAGKDFLNTVLMPC
jgi:ribose 1,5-bisphosphokinase